MTGRRSFVIGLSTTVVTLLVGTVLGTVLLLLTTYRVYQLPSRSMEPTLSVGSSVVVRRGTQVHDGDIVVFRPGTWSTSAPSGQYVKRVIASGGETVSSGADGVVMRDGHRLEEPYADIQPDQDVSASFAQVTVPPKRVFLLGDNRSSSADSRFHIADGFHGTVAVSDIVGKAVAHGSRSTTYGYVVRRALALAAPVAPVVGLVVGVVLRRRRSSGSGLPSWDPAPVH